MLAQAEAECGDVETLWEAAKSNQSGYYTGLGKWTLALDPLYKHYLADIPEYQEMVRGLKIDQNKGE